MKIKQTIDAKEKSSRILNQPIDVLQARVAEAAKSTTDTSSHQAAWNQQLDQVQCKLWLTLALAHSLAHSLALALPRETAKRCVGWHLIGACRAGLATENLWCDTAADGVTLGGTELTTLP